MKAIMVMYDSLNRHMLSPYGCDWTQTPNFKRLADRCVTFDKCYVGSLPCMPARREIHTGRYNFLHRSWGPMEPYDDSMPEILKKNGIYSHLISDHYHYWEDGGCTYHNRYSSWENVRGQEGDHWKACVGEKELPPHLGECVKQDMVNREYADTLRQIVSQILANNPESECVYLKKNQSPRTLTFMFTSDMGLCGAYNANLLRMAGEVLDPQDPMIVIGTKGTSTLRQKGFNLIREPIGSDHVDFYVDEGEVVCIVGESGCGKSVTSLSIMGLLGRGGAVIDGSVLFDGKNLLEMTEKELDDIRGNRMTMIFQDPLTSLNPVFTVGSQITESIRRHLHLSKEEAAARAESILARVGMPDAHAVMKKYPHTLSGGMRQRAMIAMALCCNPSLLIADEPTTALDVTIQAQIMGLLKELRREIGMSIILITHDIGLVASMADRVLVMYAGQIIEEAPVRELFHAPKHPYTKALLATVPSIHDGEDRQLFSIPGIVPENYDDITGCRFADRCEYRRPECDKPQKDYPFGEKHRAKCVVMKEREDKDGSGQSETDSPDRSGKHEKVLPD